MPDLLSHSLAAYIVRARPAASRRAVLFFVAGTVLPDVVSHLPGVAFDVFHSLSGIEPPGWASDAFYMFHSPLPLALLSWALALVTPRRSRWMLFGNLLGGGCLHIALDMLQRHISGVSYFVLYPLSRQGWEAGLFWTEASLQAIPLLLAVGGWIFVRRRRRGL